MIPDRIIEQNTLKTDGQKTTVEVRLPWYRSLPAASVSEVEFSVDGVAAPAESIRWTMNDRTYTLDELVGVIDEWWFPTDSVVVTGDIPLADPEADHEVRVALKLFIPYIVTEHGVLRIEEHNEKTMKAVAS
ncbi:C-glycoside deglycosidase beta subunit domain-containing protein [Subtercola sp. YIM 133946]|uniref:C-glycoside deglycosidase beta subunit domain-containing protein n=1 Tax=Subtercola sp. YIM 133946 TaxID=3118909 RepID=UPI002F92552D